MKEQDHEARGAVTRFWLKCMVVGYTLVKKQQSAANNIFRKRKVAVWFALQPEEVCHTITIAHRQILPVLKAQTEMLRNKLKSGILLLNRGFLKRKICEKMSTPTFFSSISL